MTTFTDAFGRTWEVEIDAPTFEQLRLYLGLPNDPTPDEWKGALGQLIVQPGRLADVLFMVVADQAEARQVDALEFIGQEAVDLGGVALLQATVDHIRREYTALRDHNRRY